MHADELARPARVFDATNLIGREQHDNTARSELNRQVLKGAIGILGHFFCCLRACVGALCRTMRCNLVLGHFVW
jgi:hypothetical protein